jgi:uncharacterized YigZ family protein
MLALQKAKQAYPDARHHCWAYILGSPFQANSMAMSDDGEPANTAGKPILNVLSHQNIGNIMVVVVRYFGGVKLGAGGLVRAYSQATQQLLNEVSTVPFVATVTLQATCSFSQEQYLRHVAGQFNIDILDCAYTNEVSIKMECPESAVKQVLDILTQQQIPARIQNPEQIIN